MNIRLSMLAAALALGIPALAMAQEGAVQEPVASLQVNSGSIQTSGADGQFVPAQSGVQLQPGSRVLVPSGASATMVYPGGCTVSLSPGVHTVLPTCTPPPVNVASGGGTGMGAGGAVGILATGVALTAVGMDQTLEDSDDPRPPISR